MKRSLLPLLGKELVEQAARRRTYVLRVVYTLALYACFLILFHRQAAGFGSHPGEMLGSGRDIFEALVYLQFCGIFMFLPAMMSGVVTGEKERGSLALLFLTDLRPGEILIQKYLGRLVPMFGFLFLALPLLAIAYSFGGISTDYLMSGVFLLLLACLQTGALSIMFSCYCRSTFSAFLCSYLLGGLFYAALPSVFFAPTLFASAHDDSFAQVAMHSVFVAASALFFLHRAHKCLRRRAFLPPGNPALRLFERMGEFWSVANKALAGGVVLVRDSPSLPGNEPLAWRETRKSVLGGTQHLVRAGVMAGLLILLITGFQWAYGSSAGRNLELLGLMPFAFWGVALLAVALRSADLIPSERSAQTLDILLTTPLSGREIVRQKTVGVRRMITAFLTFYLGLILLNGWRRFYLIAAGGAVKSFCYRFLPAQAAAFLWLFAAAWVSLWIGLKIQNRSRAAVAALAFVAAWVAVPALAFRLLMGAPTAVAGGIQSMSLYHAVPLLLLRAFSHRPPGEALCWLDFLWKEAAVSTLSLYAAVWWLFRRRCLDYADCYLGRPEPKSVV